MQRDTTPQQKRASSQQGSQSGKTGKPTQQPQQAQQSQQSQQSRQSQQSAGVGSSAGEQRQRADRERPIEPARETRDQTGVSRRASGSLQRPVSPFTLMQRMANDMDRLFENFGLGRSGLGLAGPFGGSSELDPWRDLSVLDQAAWLPQVETFRRGDKIVVRADLPGLKREDVKVEVDDGVLSISGERRGEQEEHGGDFYRSERSYGQFYRAVPLPDGVDGEQCDATFKDGVLEVTLAAPKSKERTAKQIPIR
jgi:HSP20 family protein